MTSNDVSQLPPELTRAGRLDATWYFSLPSTEEREQIFKIHFNKKNKAIDNSLIELASKKTEKYTGAEIELIVNNSIKRTFLEYVKTGIDSGVTADIIQKAIKDVVPVAVSYDKTISELETWAKGRALFANKVKEKDQTKKNINTLRIKQENEERQK